MEWIYNNGVMYKPPFTITDFILQKVISISEKIGKEMDIEIRKNESAVSAQKLFPDIRSLISSGEINMEFEINDGKIIKAIEGGRTKNEQN